jgi:hypothetical protein
MNALRGIYGLRRIPLAVPGLLLSASTIHLLHLPNEPAATNLVQALRDLQAISVNHHFAARCIDIIRSLAVKWNIVLPETGGSSSPAYPPGAAGMGNWPSPPASTFFAPSLPREDSSGTGTRSEGSNASGQGPFPPPMPRPTPPQYESFYGESSASRDTSHSQPSFWMPFPMQGAPTSTFNETMFDFVQGDGVLTVGGEQWAMNFAAGQPTSEHPAAVTQQNPADSVDEVSMENWNWQ